MVPIHWIWTRAIWTVHLIPYSELHNHNYYNRIPDQKLRHQLVMRLYKRSGYNKWWTRFQTQTSPHFTHKNIHTLKSKIATYFANNLNFPVSLGHVNFRTYEMVSISSLQLWNWPQRVVAGRMRRFVALTGCHVWPPREIIPMYSPTADPVARACHSLKHCIYSTLYRQFTHLFMACESVLMIWWPYLAGVVSLATSLVFQLSVSWTC